MGGGGFISKSQLRKREIPPEAVTLLVKLSDHKECQAAFVQGDSEGIIIPIVTLTIISMRIIGTIITIFGAIKTIVTIPTRGDRVCPSSCQGFLSLRNAAEVMTSFVLLLQNPPSRTRQPL